MPPNQKINNPLRVAAAAAAKARSEGVTQKLRTAMALIDKEIAANDGIYPGGKLNQREVCRRADIHYQTLQQPSHKDSTKREVDSWIKGKTAKTLHDVRKVVTDRAEHWKEQHHEVATQICIYEVELVEKDLRIAELEAEVSRMRERITELQKSAVTTLAAVGKGRK